MRRLKQHAVVLAPALGLLLIIGVIVLCTATLQPW
jgi:hypothetical protein